jgi:hypothetical protein
MPAAATPAITDAPKTLVPTVMLRAIVVLLDERELTNLLEP